MRVHLALCGVAVLACVAGCAGEQATTYSDVVAAASAANDLFAEGDRLRAEGEFYKAHKKYEEGLNAHSLTPRAEEIIRKQFEMGRKWTMSGSTGFMGLGSQRKAGVKILEDIVARTAVAAENKTPHIQGIRLCPPMEDALFALGRYYFISADYEEAGKLFKEFVDTFPDNDNWQWSRRAHWLAAECYFLQSDGAEYDEGLLNEAQQRFENYRKRYSVQQVSREELDLAAKRIRQIRNLKAQKRFLTAQLYVESEDYIAAQRYCEAVMEEYKGTEWVEPARRLHGEIEAELKKRREIE